MANIPAPVYTGGGQRGTGESLLLTLASAAPSVLMQLLQMRSQNKDAEAAGQAATGVLAGMAGQGTISPDLFAVANSNPRAAPQVLQQALTVRESNARVSASEAQTTLAKNEDTRAAARQPFELEQLREGIKTAKFNRYVEGQRLALYGKQVNATISNDAERTRLAGKQVALERQNAALNTGQYLSSLHSDQMRNYTNLTQLLGDPVAASILVFKTTKPLTLDEFVNGNVQKVQAALLQNQGAEPGRVILSTVLGDRPDVEIAQRIGLEPTNAARLNEALIQHKGDALKVYEELRRVLTAANPDQPDEVASELASAATYITIKTGERFEIPAKERRNLKRLAEYIGSNVGTASTAWGQSMGLSSAAGAP